MDEICLVRFREFWRPDEGRIQRFGFPKLFFGNGNTLEPPSELLVTDYKQNFHSRLKCLSEYGAYYTPPMVTRSIHLAYPKSVDLEFVKLFC